MSELKIITDHKWKNLLYGYELTDKEKKEFDWIDADEIDSHSFFRYRKNVYSITEFMSIHATRLTFDKPWNGYYSDSYFSGILIELSDDGEMYRVGLYLS